MCWHEGLSDRVYTYQPFQPIPQSHKDFERTIVKVESEKASGKPPSSERRAHRYGKKSGSEQWRLVDGGTNGQQRYTYHSISGEASSTLFTKLRFQGLQKSGSTTR